MADLTIFDTAEYLEATTPPVFVHEGRRYVGRVLSWKEWVELLPMLGALQQGGIAYPEAEQALAEILDALFPPPPPDEIVTGPWYAPWRRREVRYQPTAAESFARLPFPVQTELLNDFLRSQGAALERKSSPDSSRSGSKPKPHSGTTTPSPTS